MATRDTLDNMQKTSNEAEPPAGGPRTDFPPVRACIFDMDGLLINTEDIYTLCTNMVLREYGRPNIPWSIKAQLQGRPASEASAIFQKWARLPISLEEYRAKVSEHQTREWPNAQSLVGVEQLLQTLSKKTSPSIELALATSTTAARFEAKTAHLEGLFSVFARKQRVLGDDERIPRGRGKPAPDIFLVALQTINERLRTTDTSQREIKPEECLVFEDSVPGVEAGRRAGMRVVWVPHEGLLGEFRGREKYVLAGLTETLMDDDPAQQLARTVRVDAHGDGDGDGKSSQQSSESSSRRVDDGWADMLLSLEDFSYERYGINVTGSTNSSS